MFYFLSCFFICSCSFCLIHLIVSFPFPTFIFLVLISLSKSCLLLLHVHQFWFTMRGYIYLNYIFTSVFDFSFIVCLCCCSAYLWVHSPSPQDISQEKPLTNLRLCKQTARSWPLQIRDHKLFPPKESEVLIPPVTSSPFSTFFLSPLPPLLKQMADFRRTQSSIYERRRKFMQEESVHVLTLLCVCVIEALCKTNRDSGGLWALFCLSSPSPAGVQAGAPRTQKTHISLGLQSCLFLEVKANLADAPPWLLLIAWRYAHPYKERENNLNTYKV